MTNHLRCLLPLHLLSMLSKPWTLTKAHHMAHSVPVLLEALRLVRVSCAHDLMWLLEGLKVHQRQGPSEVSGRSVRQTAALCPRQQS